MEVGNLYVKLGMDDQDFRTKLLEAQRLLANFDKGFLTNFGRLDLGISGSDGEIESSGVQEQISAFGKNFCSQLLAGIQDTLPDGFASIQKMMLVGVQTIFQQLMHESTQFEKVGSGIVQSMEVGVMAKTNALTAKVVNAIQQALAAANALLGSASFAIPSVGFSSPSSSTPVGFSSSNFSSNKPSKSVSNQTTVNFDFKDTTLTPDTLKKTMGLLNDIDPTYF